MRFFIYIAVMLKSIKKFSELEKTEKKLFVEAYVVLGLTRLALLTMSFKRIVAALEHHQYPVELLALSEKDCLIAQTIGRAIQRAANHTLWDSACLAQALTAQRMLQKRRIPGVFYLGVIKNNSWKEKMKAHAWSQCGNSVITGGKGHEKFTIMSVFGWSK